MNASIRREAAGVAGARDALRWTIRRLHFVGERRYAPAPTPAAGLLLATTVLGHYPGYIALSDQIGSRRFDMDPGVWAGLPHRAQWAANQYFLDAMADADDIFVLSADPTLARPGSWFFHELNHLRQRGVSVAGAPTSVWVS